MPRPTAQLIQRVLAERPDFCDPETELEYVAEYTAAHDQSISLEGTRTVEEEYELAYCRALLAQHGIEESRLCWELSVSYNLRLSEYLDRQFLPNRPRQLKR